MPPKPRRRRRNTREQFYVDEIAVTLADAGSVDYQTTDVRVNKERPYKIVYAHCFLSSPNGAVVQVAIYDADAATSGAGIQGMIASSGLITVGQNVTRIRVRNEPSTDFVTPSGPDTTLIRISSIVKGHSVVGTLRVGIRCGREVEAPQSARVLRGSPDSPFESVSGF